MLTRDKVAAVSGGWTSASRKSALPIFEELNGLLLYSVAFEGEESSPNVFYFGAVPNQQAIPAAEYLMSETGGSARRWVLFGTDYVYPRVTNKILRYFLHSKGVGDDDIMEKYTPFGFSNYETVVADIKKFVAVKRAAIVSTITGDSNVPFYRELGSQGIGAHAVPSVALAVDEEDLRGIDTKPFVGQLAARGYFMSIDAPENRRFVGQWKSYVAAKQLSGGATRVTNDPMEATYIGVSMWAHAVQEAGTADVDKVREAMSHQALRAPSGHTVTMDATSHHLHRPLLIGEIETDGQFQIVWKSREALQAQVFSPYLPENQSRTP